MIRSRTQSKIFKNHLLIEMQPKYSLQEERGNWKHPLNVPHLPHRELHGHLLHSLTQNSLSAEMCLRSGSQIPGSGTEQVHM